MPQTSDAAKATLVISKVGPGLGLGSVSGSLSNTVRIKNGPTLATLTFSDRSLVPATCSKFTDVVATLDHKVKDVTANTKYELGTKKYTVGATWDPKVTDGVTQVRGWYSNKDNIINGDATVVLNKSQRALITFNQKKILACKYTWANKDWVVSPTYNFAKESTAIAVTRKLPKDLLTLSYDNSTHMVSTEWAHKPFRVVMQAPLTHLSPPKLAPPTVSAIYENVFNF